ncbi:MAG: MBL fold metallo-hydrolase [Bacilli bacterium]|nr:MBL fold metallo-hydrolase [Bacilli bacterium]
MKIELIFFNHNCNTYLLINGHDCLVVDPGYNEHDCLIKAITKRGLTLRGVLLTHAHYDHTLGLKTMKKVPIYLHQAEEATLHSSRDNCSFMSLNQFTVDDVKTKLLKDQDELDLYGMHIKVIHTPFHTAGSVCFYLPELKTVLTGDTLFFNAIGRSDLPTSEPRKIRESLTKLFTLPMETIVYPGHGNKTTLKDEYRFVKNEYL